MSVVMCVAACDTGQWEDELAGPVGRAQNPLWAVHGLAALLPRHRTGRCMDD